MLGTTSFVCSLHLFTGIETQWVLSSRQAFDTYISDRGSALIDYFSPVHDGPFVEYGGDFRLDYAEENWPTITCYSKSSPTICLSSCLPLTAWIPVLRRGILWRWRVRLLCDVWHVSVYRANCHCWHQLLVWDQADHRLAVRSGSEERCHGHRDASITGEFEIPSYMALRTAMKCPRYRW